MDENTNLPPDPAPPEPEAVEPEAQAEAEPASDPVAPEAVEPEAESVSDSAPPEPEAAEPEVVAPETVAPEPVAPETVEPETEIAPADESAAVIEPEIEPGDDSAPPAGEPVPAHPEQERLAQENAQRLESEIEALHTGHMDGTRRRFRTFFEHERRLHDLFKELRPLHPHDRHRLWKSLKQAGAEARRAQQEEWESRRYQSIEARETVDERLRAAEAQMQTASTGTEYRRIESLLNEIRNLLGNPAPGSTGQLLIGPDRRACWDRWRAVRDALRKKHGVRQETAHHELSLMIVEVAALAAEGDPFQATQRIKELQAQLGKADLRRGQFEELRKRLSTAWQAAQGRMVEQRHERSRQRAEWRGRMEQHLGRWQETLEQKRGQLGHLVEQAAKLIEMEKRARSEEFAEQVRQWQAATAEKRRRTEESIAELEQRVRETERRAGGRRPPGGGGTRGAKPRRAGANAAAPEAESPAAEPAPEAPAVEPTPEAESPAPEPTPAPAEPAPDAREEAPPTES
jgi:hypothetical protein